MKIWREVAIPHQDVLKGTFLDSEFAADISQVQQGKATPEYQDAKQFFSRTFITEGMRLLLDSVIRRLSGAGGDPIIQLQTAFGGGKTHTLLAVYHLAQKKYPHSELSGISTLLEQAEIFDLPKTNVAVIDGINLSPQSSKSHGSIACYTLWGELAYQLGGEDGYKKVEGADKTGTSPDKDTVAELLAKASPCVILMDELVAFYRQFQEGKTYPAGSFETNMTFIQVLTEAIKTVPKAILLASLPDSHNAGEGRGQVVLSVLEGYFRRLQKIWKPVSKEEAFGIVRRRLIEKIEDERAVEEVCRSFSKAYVENQASMPPETQESQYITRMCASYPIHPEIFDRLYEDWSTLQNFQRTRGVLQFLAQVIHRLWKDGNSDYLIMPGNIPLYDSVVRDKALDYLPQGWDPVIDQDIDGEQSRPAQIENQEPRFGSLQAARKAARTIFLGSAPGIGKRQSKGISIERIFLGCFQPGQTIGVFEDVLKRLADKLSYINVDKNQFWFEITPNLRREMESRKGRFKEQDDIYPLLKTYLAKEYHREHLFAGVHIFSDSADIPDEIGQGLRLVILDSKAHYRKGADELAFHGATQILRNRGDQPRQYQNRLLFLSPDADVLDHLLDICRVHLAWKSIVTDIANEALVLDNIQIKNAKKQAEESEKHIYRMVKETYKWLLCPCESFKDNKPQLTWEVTALPSMGLSTMRDVEDYIIENKQWVASKWGPQLLERLLNQWYFKDKVTEVSANRIWQDLGKYLYMPRLVNESVFQDTLQSGVQSEDFFGIALDREGEKLKGFEFGSHALIQFYSSMIIIEKNAAHLYKMKENELKASEKSAEKQDLNPGGTQVDPNGLKPGKQPLTSGAGKVAKTRFYGSIMLDALTAKVGFSEIFDEVVEQLTIDPATDVHVTVEISATNKQGFDEQKQRVVKENCATLRFGSVEFEE